MWLFQLRTSCRFVAVRAEIAHLLSEHASAGQNTGQIKIALVVPVGPSGRRELIGDVNRRVSGITFARLFLDDGISNGESMRPKWSDR